MTTTPERPSTAPELTLTGFLLARIAEDETAVIQIARYSITPEAGGREYCHESAYGDVNDDIHSGRGDNYLVVDPARVLAEVEAKRRIVEWCGERAKVFVGTYAADAQRPEHFVDGALTHLADSVVLRMLAEVYADHPDYRPEWRP